MTAQNFQFKTKSRVGAVRARGGKSQAKTKPAIKSRNNNMDQLAFEAILEGNFSKARKILDDGLVLYPTSVNLHRLSGDVYLRQDDPDSALRAYMEAMTLDPLSTVTLNWSRQWSMWPSATELELCNGPACSLATRRLSVSPVRGSWEAPSVVM